MFRFKILSPCLSPNRESQLSDLTAYEFEFSTSIDHIKEDWQITVNDDIFWQHSFLKMVEEHGPSGIVPYYCLIKVDSNVVGVAYFQLKKILLNEALNQSHDGHKTAPITVKSIVASRINFYNLVCGNMLLTGKYGFNFIVPLEKIDQFSLINKAIQQFIDSLAKQENIQVGTVLIKDFFEEDALGDHTFENYTAFFVQPNMIMDIREWSSFDAYMAAMKTKYRTRINRAFKKFAEVEKRELFLDDLDFHQTTMHRLYKNIALNAGFNLFLHRQDYFLKLKEAIGDSLIVIGYFIGDEMVGFYTMIDNQQHLDAHFLGYEHKYNAEYQLYLNMLLDMVRKGIGMKKDKLIMSRTAMEIKSSIGAEAFDMVCYLKHTKPWINRLVPTILKYMNPKQEWLPRSPFKDE